MSTNGQSVTRAELAAHIRRIDESLDFMRADVAEINEKLASPGRWVRARFSHLLDYALVGAFASAVAILVNQATG